MRFIGNLGEGGVRRGKEVLQVMCLMAVALIFKEQERLLIRITDFGFTHTPSQPLMNL
jgi:hypothetical protein